MSAEGIRMDPDKLANIWDWPILTNLMFLRRFLGFTNFYRRFVAAYSGLAAPLVLLTKEGVDVQEGMKSLNTVQAFKRLKEVPSTALLLRHFDFSRRKVVQVDSSGFALSDILSQPDE